MKVVPEFVAEDCVGSTEDVSSDTEGQGVGKTEEGGGDGEGTKGVENGLPWIACRVANADSAESIVWIRQSLTAVPDKKSYDLTSFLFFVG